MKGKVTPFRKWVKAKVKVKVKVKSLYLTSVVPSATRLVLMEADGAPFTPLPLSVLRFTGIQSYGYTDQRKVEADLSLRKPRASQLSHDWVRFGLDLNGAGLAKSLK